MSGWTPDFTNFTDLFPSDVPQAHPEDDSSPIHRRSDVGSSPHPRALFPSGAPPPGPYGPYPPPPGPYGPYPPPPYPYPPPPYAPPAGTGTASPPPYPPPSYGPYAPPPYPYAPYPQYAPYQPPPAPTAPSSGSESQNEATDRIQPRRAKRLEWTTEDENKLVHAWLFHSKDSITGNSQTGGTFWGQIAHTFNSTSAPSRHRTAKQLKDHWSVYNREVSLFNAYHIQEERIRQSGADDKMVMDAAMARYENDPKVTQPFRRHHWWEAVRKEQKWIARNSTGSGSDSTAKKSRLGVSGEHSSGTPENTEEEERPIGRDRAKAAARREKGRVKGKGKDTSSSSEVRSKMSGTLGNLVKAKLLKQWNRMRERSTADMDDAEKRRHAKAIAMVEKDLGLDDDENEED